MTFQGGDCFLIEYLKHWCHLLFSIGFGCIATSVMFVSLTSFSCSCLYKRSKSDLCAVFNTPSFKKFSSFDFSMIQLFLKFLKIWTKSNRVKMLSVVCHGLMVSNFLKKDWLYYSTRLLQPLLLLIASGLLVMLWSVHTKIPNRVLSQGSFSK